MSPALAGGFFTAEPSGKALGTDTLFASPCCGSSGFNFRAEPRLPSKSDWRTQPGTGTEVAHGLMAEPLRAHLTLGSS